jgi:hypothetical protein
VISEILDFLCDSSFFLGNKFQNWIWNHVRKQHKTKLSMRTPKTKLHTKFLCGRTKKTPSKHHTKNVLPAEIEQRAPTPSYVAGNLSDSSVKRSLRLQVCWPKQLYQLLRVLQVKPTQIHINNSEIMTSQTVDTIAKQRTVLLGSFCIFRQQKTYKVKELVRTSTLIRVRQRSYSMYHIPPWEANSSSPSREINPSPHPNVRNTIFHFLDHKLSPWNLY